MTPAHSAAFRTLKQALATATLAVGLLSAGGAAAQQAGSPFVGFTQNRSEPINFEADRAEVFDNEKRAVLSGNVRIQQGESTLQTARLVIFYEGSAAASSGRPATTTPRQGGAAAASPTQNVRRFEMQGGVIVRSKNQTATAERGASAFARPEGVTTSLPLVEPRSSTQTPTSLPRTARWVPETVWEGA